jgi:hypothetical protein
MMLPLAQIHYLFLFPKTMWKMKVDNATSQLQVADPQVFWGA